MRQRPFELPDSDATERFGGQLACATPAGSVIYLYGDLGAGKTTWVRGYLRQLGYQGTVKSPTYTLLEQYSFQRVEIFHLDLYRLAEPEELDYLGLRELLDERSIALVEWPQQGLGYLPDADLVLHLHYQGGGRVAELLARSDTGEQIIGQLPG